MERALAFTGRNALASLRFAWNRKLHLGCLLVVLWAASAFDPFGVKNNTNRFSQKIFYQVLAPYYPNFNIWERVDLENENRQRGIGGSPNG